MISMDNLRDMSSTTNSLEGIKEKYKKGVIENFQFVVENQRKIVQDSVFTSMSGPKAALRYAFTQNQYKECHDASLGSNDRWGIVAGKNLFGLEASILPEKEEGKKIVLKACSGRFQMQKFPQDFFTKTIDISDIRERSENEQYAEIEEFYNMNNRQVFEKYGVFAQCGDGNGERINLIANTVVLDSLLKGRYSEISNIYCYSPAGGYHFKIKLADGTEITANSGEMIDTLAGKKGITIKKDEKEATVDFDAISTGEKSDILTNINELEVENVEYSGDLEMVQGLQQAMQEQFESQREQNQSLDNKTVAEYENWYERYDEMASKLLDKAGVSSYEEEYELEQGLTISCTNNGSTVLVKSDKLGITFVADSKLCAFSDIDYEVNILYGKEHGERTEELLSIEENLNNLEQTEPENKEIIEKMKQFAQILEQLTRDEKTKGETTQEQVDIQSVNELLLSTVINGGIKKSDVQNLQQTLIKAVEKSKDEPNLEENEFHD